MFMNNKDQNDIEISCKVRSVEAIMFDLVPLSLFLFFNLVVQEKKIVLFRLKVCYTDNSSSTNLIRKTLYS